jgi:hypothetical protein
MKASRFDIWRTWLILAAAGTAVFGVAMTLTSSTVVFDAFNQRIDPVFWQGDPIPPAAVAFRQWIYATWGATIAGLGSLVSLVAHFAFRRHQVWVRNSLAAVLATWYALDTGASLAWGVSFNVAFNTAILLVLGLPLLFTWRAFGSAMETPTA